MNRLAKVAVLLVSLVAVFSFSQQDSLSTQREVQKDRVIIYDTVTISKIVSDLAAIEALRDLLMNYPNSFHELIVVGLVLIGIAVVIFWNRRVIRKINKRIKRLRKDIQKLFKQQQDDHKERLDSNKKETLLIDKKISETAQVKSEKEEFSKDHSEKETVNVK
jgi:hypothetical protein